MVLGHSREALPFPPVNTFLELGSLPEGPQASKNNRHWPNSTLKSHFPHLLGPFGAKAIKVCPDKVSNGILTHCPV